MTEAPGARAPAVALLPWGLLYDEDYLDPIGVSLEAFCAHMSGGYLFNYVDALAHAGIRAIIVLVARRVRRPVRMTHAATGATVLVLPASRARRAAATLKRLTARSARLRSAFDDLADYLVTPAASLIGTLRRERCAAVICQEYEYTRFDTCVLIGKVLRIPVFATFQGGTWSDGSLQRRLRPLALRHCSGLVIGPREEIRRVRERYGVPLARIARIFNPLDPDAFAATGRAEARAALGLPAGARVALWYGRVDREIKGLDILLDAWQRVSRERPDADLCLLLIGTGVDADWLRGRVAGVPSVRWRDEYVHDRGLLRLHLSAADVFAFPSRREGFPVAPMEAMACAVPVVAAAAPGVPDILEDGEATGGIMVPRDDPAALALRLGELLDDRERARRIGEAGRARAQASFSLEAVGRQLRDFMIARGLRVPQAPHV